MAPTSSPGMLNGESTLSKKAVGKRKQLDEQQRFVAILLASGASPSQVAVQTGLTLRQVNFARRSPLLQAYVRELQEQMVERISGEAVSLLDADKRKNVEFLTHTRDGNKDAINYDPEDTDFFRHRLKASEVLLDRQVPKRVEQTIDVSGRIVIEKDDKAALDEIAIEVAGEHPVPSIGDVEDFPLTVDEDGEAVGLRTCSDLLAQLEVEENAEVE